MKYIFATLFILPLFSLAQDCTIKKEIDKFSNEPKLTTGFIPLNGGAMLSIEANNKEIDFFFTLNNAAEGKCFDDASTATVSYEGGRLKASFKNTGSMNCDGLFHFTFKNTTSTPSALQRLATIKISTLSFAGSSGTPAVIHFTAEQKEMFMKMASCMINEAKTLLNKTQNW